MHKFHLQAAFSRDQLQNIRIGNFSDFYCHNNAS